MDSKTSSYRQIAKAFGIFGGVQIITFLVQIFKSKFIAIFLGPDGYGISSLFNSSLSFITAITSLGISYSAVKDIALANNKGDNNIRNSIISVFLKWTYVTGIIGAAIIIVFSKQISIWTFGNINYRWSFVFLSLTLIISAYSNSQKTILQGLGNSSIIAKITVIGGVLSSCTVILYYFYGQNGIVPSIIISAAILGLVSWFFSRNLNIEFVRNSPRNTFYMGLDMVKLGILMTLSGYFYQLGTYLLNIFINHINGPKDVGLYQSGWSITNQFLSLVFTAISIDYYPRLASIGENNVKVRKLVNQQAEITLLVVGPLILILIIFVPLAIRLFLTTSFLPISNFIRLTSLGLLFKAVQWCLGYVLIIKGDSKRYLFLEIAGYSFIFLSFMLGYNLYGLNGIGLAFIIGYFSFLLFYYIVLYRNYNFAFYSSFKRLFFFIASFCILAIFAVTYGNGILKYFFGITLLIITIIYCFLELDKRIMLKKLFFK